MIPSWTLSPVRIAAGDLLLAVGLIFTVQLSAVMLRRIAAVTTKQVHRKAFWLEMLLCGVYMVFALDVRMGIFNPVGTALRRCIAVTAGILIRAWTAAILIIGALILLGGRRRPVRRAETLIVPGAAMENGNATPALRRRLETAAEYALAHPEVRLVVTGGNGADGITEAAVMRRILLEKGIAPERIRTEDQAVNTRENFRNSARMVDPSRPAAIVTTGCHMRRAVRLAREAGFASLRLAQACVDRASPR